MHDSIERRKCSKLKDSTENILNSSKKTKVKETDDRKNFKLKIQGFFGIEIDQEI